MRKKPAFGAGRSVCWCFSFEGGRVKSVLLWGFPKKQTRMTDYLEMMGARSLVDEARRFGAPPFIPQEVVF